MRLFGTKDVLIPNGSGNTRFYVMALNDVSSSSCTYDQAMQKEQNGWNVPSNEIWAAFFGGALGITSSTYSQCGLKGEYWVRLYKTF